MAAGSVMKLPRTGPTVSSVTKLTTPERRPAHRRGKSSNHPARFSTGFVADTHITANTKNGSVKFSDSR